MEWTKLTLATFLIIGLWGCGKREVPQLSRQKISERHSKPNTVGVGIMNNGKEEGVWQFFQSERLVAIGTYKNGIRTGFWVEFYTNDGIKSIGRYSYPEDANVTIHMPDIGWEETEWEDTSGFDFSQTNLEDSFPFQPSEKGFNFRNGYWLYFDKGGELTQIQYNL